LFRGRLIRQDKGDAILDWFCQNFQPFVVMDMLHHVAYFAVFAGFTAGIGFLPDF
jgi:hypothetical protein